MTDRIIIRKNNRILDVFHGEEGFAEQQWSRFLLVNKTLKFIKGAQMSVADLQTLKQMVGA